MKPDNVIAVYWHFGGT